MFDCLVPVCPVGHRVRTGSSGSSRYALVTAKFFLVRPCARGCR